MTGSADKLSVGVMIKAVIRGDQIKTREVADFVILWVQYANYTDVFDKFCADIQLKHTQQNLAIKTEDNKILFLILDMTTIALSLKCCVTI